MLYLLIDALLVPLFNSVLVLVLVACSSSPFWKRRGGDSYYAEIWDKDL